MQTILFDVETGPLADSELSALLPPFDPAEVKTGNLKDPAKIAEKISEAAANHRRDFIDRAALDPLSGRVVAIGVLLVAPHDRADKQFGRGTSSGLRPPSPQSGEGHFSIIGHEDEARTLREFWDLTRGEMGRNNPMIGFNIFNFDLPFLIRRSWKHRVEVPFGIRRGRYWGEQLLDLRDAWQLGDRQARGSLDSIAKHLGVGGKNGDGKAFAELWRSDRKSAEAYLRNDIDLTAKVAAALGVVF